MGHMYTAQNATRIPNAAFVQKWASAHKCKLPSKCAAGLSVWHTEVVTGPSKVF